MDQLCSIDGNFPKTWQEIKSEPHHQFKGKTPGWFTKLEDTCTLALNNRRLLTPLNHLPTLRFTFTGPPIHESLLFTFARPTNGQFLGIPSLNQNYTERLVLNNATRDTPSALLTAHITSLTLPRTLG